METAWSSTHDPLGIGWTILRLALVLLLLLPVLAGMVVAAARAYRKRRARRDGHGTSSRARRRCPLRWSASAWPARRVMLPPSPEHRPWRAHRR